MFTKIPAPARSSFQPRNHFGEVGPVKAGTAVGLSANGTLVYVLCRGTGRLLYLDRVRLTVLDSVELGD